jgi:hypothetical protein
MWGNKRRRRDVPVDHAGTLQLVSASARKTTSLRIYADQLVEAETALRGAQIDSVPSDSSTPEGWLSREFPFKLGEAFKGGSRLGIRCGIIYLGLVISSVFLKTHDSKYLTLPVLAFCGIILAALPPLYFLAEYQLFEYWAKKGKETYPGNLEVTGWIEEERSRVKHNETLARNIWAGIMAILAALIIKGSNDGHN